MVQSHPPAAAVPLDNAEMDLLQASLDTVPAPLQALDLSSLDGFLCGVLLQPGEVAVQRWLRYVTDIEGRVLPAGFDHQRIHKLVLRRYDELKLAIDARDWFDPWVFEFEQAASPAQSVLAWSAGFASAMEIFPDLMRTEDSALLEPLAVLYMHFDAEDLDDADVLREVIDSLEPPTELAEAVQDLVRSVMLIADVTRPRPASSTAQLRSAPGRGRKKR